MIKLIVSVGEQKTLKYYVYNDRSFDIIHDEHV